MIISIKPGLFQSNNDYFNNEETRFSISEASLLRNTILPLESATMACDTDMRPVRWSTGLLHIMPSQMVRHLMLSASTRRLYTF